MENLQHQTNDLTYDKIWEMFQETDKKFQETREILDKKFQDTDKKFQDTDKKFQETEKFIKELGIQIGGIHNGFGIFTEGLLNPTIEKILMDRFDCKTVFKNNKFRDNGNSFEIDVLGESETACYLVEIKGNLRAEEAIEQHNNKIEKFSKFNKRYADLPKFGIISAVHFNDNDLLKIYNAGFYFISVIDDIAKLIIPDNFQPRQWE